MATFDKRLTDLERALPGGVCGCMAPAVIDVGLGEPLPDPEVCDACGRPRRRAVLREVDDWRSSTIGGEE